MSAVLTDSETVSEFPLAVIHFSSIIFIVDLNCQSLGILQSAKMLKAIFKKKSFHLSIIGIHGVD